MFVLTIKLRSPKETFALAQRPQHFHLLKMCCACVCVCVCVRARARVEVRGRSAGLMITISELLLGTLGVVLTLVAILYP